jgi:fatty acid amide hydrolase
MRAQKKRDLYDQWIQRALQEREARPHTVFSNTMTAIAEEEDDDDAYLSATQTNSLIRRKKLNAKANVIRLGRRTHEFGRILCAVAEEFYDEAAVAADKLPSYANKDSPLYGVPVSIKEHIRMKGSYSTGGLACRLTERDKTDAVMVSILRQQGALPICSGNNMQILMLPETVNRIWGRAKNPWDLTRATGGSSGGDAALVAMGCVPLALGSDVAGSIRIPSFFCGVTGFKPTGNRVSKVGMLTPRLNERSGTSVIIPCSLGPIARSVDDCAAMMKAVWVPELFKADLAVTPLPFDENAYESKKKLRIGYFLDDGWFRPCQTSQRAVREAIEGLEQAGHECVVFDLPIDGWDSYCLLVALNSGDGSFKTFLDALDGEPVVDEYATLIMAAKLPDFLRWIVVRFLDRRRSTLLQQTRAGGLTVREYWEKTADLTSYRTQWAEAMQGFDALVYPGMPIPALKHGTSSDLTAAVSYMFPASMLDWPTGAVPVTTIRPDEAHYPLEDLPVEQRDVIATMVQTTMEGSQGMPMGVSVMAPPHRDETCLYVMKEVERSVNFTATPQAFRGAAEVLS